MRDAQFGELLDEMNSKQKQIRYATIFGVGVGAVGLGVLYLGGQVVPYLGGQVGMYVLLLALPAWAIGRWVDAYLMNSAATQAFHAQLPRWPEAPRAVLACGATAPQLAHVEAVARRGEVPRGTAMR